MFSLKPYKLHITKIIFNFINNLMNLGKWNTHNSSYLTARDVNIKFLYYTSEYKSTLTRVWQDYDAFPLDIFGNEWNDLQ